MKRVILFFIFYFSLFIICNAQIGNIITMAGNGSCGFTGDSGQATAAEVSIPSHISFDSSGNLYFADFGNNRVRKLATTGIINTVASGGILLEPQGVTVDDSGNIYIADGGNEVVLKVVASKDSTYIFAGIPGYISKGYSGDGGQATAAQLDEPTDVALDDSGNLYIADFHNNVIRKVIVSTGIISTVVGNGYGYWDGPGTWTGANTGDGGPATAASFYGTESVSFDKAGNMYIADDYNHAIRKVTKSTNIVTTVAGNGYDAGGPGGYSGDGGPATAAELFYPQDAATDDSGNIYIADNGNNRIRKVNAITGIINTVAGNGTLGYSGNGGPATSAELNQPNGVAFDKFGNLCLSDDCDIRKVINTTTGINEIKQTNEVYVYPNPNNGSFTLEYEFAENKTANVILYNTVGEKVGEYNLTGSEGKINITNYSLSNGVYFYKVYGNDQVIKIGKIIIIK